MTQTPTHDGSTTLGLIVDSTPVTAPSVPPPVVPVTVPVNGKLSEKATRGTLDKR